MSNGGRELSVIGVAGQIGLVVTLETSLRGEASLPDGGVRFTVGASRELLTLTVHVTDADLYDVTLLCGGEVVGSWPGCYPDSLGAVVRQLFRAAR